MNFKSVEEILDFAIKNEVEAAALYTDLAERVDRPHVKKVLLGFAEEERGHKAKLEAVKTGRTMLGSQERVVDLKIGDYLVEAEVADNMSYQDVLILAMQKEKAAFKLYNDLAQAAPDPGIQELFLGLAQEEAKHKLRFEVEYDEQIMTEN